MSRNRKYLPASFFGVLLTAGIVFFAISMLFYRSFDPRSQAVGAIACNSTCQVDADCGTGYCYQAPMPTCSSAGGCLQVMPKKVCRNRACSGDTTCGCPSRLPTKASSTTTSRFTSDPFSWPHISSGKRMMLVVSFSYRSPGGNNANTVARVTYGEGSPQQLKKIRRDIGGEYVTELWYGMNPISGTHNVSVQFSGTVDSIVANATTYQDVDQTNPIRVNALTQKIEGVGNSVSAGTGRSPGYPKTFSLIVPTSPSELVAAVTTTYAGNANTVQSAPTQGQLYNTTIQNTIGIGTLFSPSQERAALSWTSSVGWPWAASAISIQPDRTPEVTPMPVRILGIGYNPSENGRGIAETYYQSSMGTLTPSQMEDSIFTKTKDAFSSLSKGKIQYSIVAKTRVTTFQPYTNGFSYTLSSFSKCVLGRPEYDPVFCETQKGKFNYDKWYADNRICEQAEAANADEIWVVVPPYIMTWENIMVGPTAGFDVNGPYKIYPKCKKHMVVVHGTYEKNADLLHVMGHRFEATMQYLMSTWTAQDKEQFWERFVAYKLYSGVQPTSPYCGNAHFTSNSTTDYSYDNREKTATSTCLDFGNFPDYNGTSATGNCTLWGCTELGWDKYWLGNVPISGGSTSLTSKNAKTFSFPKNWWSLWLYPDAAILQKTKM